HIPGVVVHGGAPVEGEAACGFGDVHGGEGCAADGGGAVGVGEGDALAGGGQRALEGVAGVAGDNAVTAAGRVDAAAAAEGFRVVVGVAVVSPAAGLAVGVEGDGLAGGE